MLTRLLLIGLSACLAGLLVYVGCVVWPLDLPDSTGLVAGSGVALCWALVLAVYLDSRSNEGRDKN